MAMMDRAVPDYGDSSDPDVRAKYGYLEASVSIAGNVGLFLLKFILGLFINSIALIADAIHSLSDVATSGVVILGFRIARKPPDAEHPFGHGRMEYIATLVIAIILGITGLEFIIQSVERFSDLGPFANEDFALIVAVAVLASAAVKELMARYSDVLAKRISSDVLSADAWHHRSDAISSIGVAVSIIGSRYGYPILDPIFGIVVAVIIIYVGIRLVRTSSNFLLGTAPDSSIVEEVKALAASVEGVEGVHDLSVHDYGSSKVLTLHVEVEKDLLLEEAHTIADELDRVIVDQTPFTTIIHLDPSDQRPSESDLVEKLEHLLESREGVVSYHKMQVIKRRDHDDISLHLIVDKDMSVEKSHEMCHDIETSLKQMYGDCKLVVHFEPCGSDCMACSIKCQYRVDMGTRP